MCSAVAFTSLSQIDLGPLIAVAITVGMMQIVLASVFVWYMHRRDCRYTTLEKHRDQSMQTREHACHEFQRKLNDNTLEAFKQVVSHLSESKTALKQSTRVTVQAMRVLAQFRPVKPPAVSPPSDQGENI